MFAYSPATWYKNILEQNEWCVSKVEGSSFEMNWGLLLLYNGNSLNVNVTVRWKTINSKDIFNFDIVKSMRENKESMNIGTLIFLIFHRNFTKLKLHQ